jgi:hypothetical protein
MLPSHTTTVSFCHEWMTTSKTLQELETCAYFVTPLPQLQCSPTLPWEFFFASFAFLLSLYQASLQKDIIP